jgi:hypothetical protein
MITYWDMGRLGFARKEKEKRKRERVSSHLCVDIIED